MEPLFTPEQLAEVSAYHAPGYLYSLIEFGVWPVVMTAITAWGTRPLFALARRITSGLESKVMDRVWRGEGWAASVAFSELLFFAFALLNLPADVWFGWFHEHEHGLSTASAATFVLDAAKSRAITAAAVGALALGVFGLARRLSSWWWIVGAVGGVALSASVLLDPYRNQVYVDQVPLEEGPLERSIASLMAKASLEFSEVRVEKTSSRTVRLQAYFAGAGPTRAIVLNDSLVRGLTEAEILAAVAHEAGHVGAPLWPRQLMVIVVLFGWLGFMEWVFRRAAAGGWFGITERADIRVLPLLVLVFDLAMTAGAPATAAVSRRAETRADAFAVRLTQDPAAFISMLTKAARVNKMDPSPPAWVRPWLSHPTIADRIAAISAVGASASP